MSSIYDLAPDPEIEVTNSSVRISSCRKVKMNKTGNILGLFMLWIIVAIVTAVILTIWNPPFVRENDNNGDPTEDIDLGKVVVSSLLISSFIVLIIFFIRLSIRYNKKH